MKALIQFSKDETTLSADFKLSLKFSKRFASISLYLLLFEIVIALNTRFKRPSMIVTADLQIVQIRNKKKLQKLGTKMIRP